MQRSATQFVCFNTYGTYTSPLLAGFEPPIAVRNLS